jgi:MFS family permease
MERPYRWVIVGAGALMGCIAMGAMFSLAVFIEPLTQDTGWSRAGVSAGMTLNFLVMGFGGFFWGALSDRIGPRPVVLIGAVLLGSALLLASRASSLLQFQLSYGVLVGLSASAFFAPLIAATTAWFDTNRGLAVSLVSAGMGVAPLTMSPLARWLITAYEWRSAMWILGLIVWAIVVPAALLIRSAPVPSTRIDSPMIDSGSISNLSQALRSPQFLTLGFTFFACCAAHSGPIFHMVSYAMHHGIAPMAAVSVYSVEGLAGLGGRILFGVLADRFSVKRIIVVGLFAQAVIISAYAFIDRLGEFYALAAIFGTIYGGVMPLYAVLAREYFGQAIMGAVFGAATMLSSLGMSIGPLAGGWVFDTFGNYSWMFAGSFAIGLGAAAIALAFPPVRTHARTAIAA